MDISRLGQESGCGARRRIDAGLSAGAMVDPPDKMMKSDRKRQIPLILGGVVFIIGGVDALQNHDLLIGVSSLLAGVLNLTVTLFINTSWRNTAAVILCLNALVAGIMAVTTILAGKQYLQYAWAVAALFFLIAAFATYRFGQRSSPGR